MYVYIYTYIYTYMYTYIYIYIGSVDPKQENCERMKGLVI